MKGFDRPDPRFSLCGLMCGLCPIHHMANGCPGCGGGAGNQSCAIARCSLEHGGVDYCFQCGEYPCERFAHFDDADSFISHYRRAEDLERLREIGPEAYAAEQREKRALLQALLERHLEGRRKSLFFQAVNLLPLTDIRRISAELEESCGTCSRAERAALAERRFLAAAERDGISLRLRRKARTGES